MRNISACKALTEITRSSFGPSGLNKLVVNNLEKLFLTNDAGTIMREVEVEHPAAKLLLMASQQQEKEHGDGTNLVVLLAGELLAAAEELLRIGLRPAQIVEGYEMAYRKAMELLEAEAMACHRVESFAVELRKTVSDKEDDANVDSSLLRTLVKSVVGSKQFGYEQLLTRLTLEAVKIAYGDDSTGSFEPDSVRFTKVLGGALPMSTVIPGLVLEREPLGQVKSVRDAKVAVFACPINISRTETKGTVLIKGAQELLQFSKGEEDILKGQIEAVAAAGVNVVVTGETVGELAMHFIERAGMMVLKVPSKFALRALCKATGATPLARLGAPTAEEMGLCDAVEMVEVGSDRLTVFRQSSAGMHRTRLATILLRSNTASLLDDVERALMDALAVCRSLSRGDGRLGAGAGATEIELARSLSAYGETTPGVVQYAIRKFAEAFEVVPRVLATNGGHDSTQAIARLYWAHQQGSQHTGLDIESGEPVDVAATRTAVLDLLGVKKSAVHLAVDAALTVLRVDQIIMSKLATGPKARPAGPQDADD